MRLTGPEGAAPPIPSRRLVAAGLFTLGYAMAGAGAQAQPMTTPTEGLVTEQVTYPAAGGHPMPAYVARPAGPGRKPVVIVASEIFGIHAYIMDVCHRLARLGYVAIAPDYFDRAGDPALLPDFASIRPIVAATPMPQVLADTDAAVAWLRQQPYASRQLGITGFCWGGALVWLACTQIAGLAAGVAWYGRLAPPADDPARAAAGAPWPLERAAHLRAPVLGLYADNDRSIPLSEVARMRAALEAAGNPTRSRIDVFAQTDHGFHADYRDSYNAAAATDGWGRMLAWFQSAGVG
jgi:carboxymethylenebutenolidase